jgi:hypothetical protein
MGTPFSGKNGKVRIVNTDVADVLKWTWNQTSNNPSYASNSTAGHKKRVLGVKDGTGTIEFLRDSAAAQIINVGESVTLLLYEDGTKNHSVPAVIDSLSEAVDVDNGDLVRMTANFSQNGAPTLATYP